MAKEQLKTEEKKTEKIEREYIINIRKEINKVPYYMRAPKAIRAIKKFLVRHMKVRDKDSNKIKLDRYLNEFLWARGIRNPQTRIKIKVIKEGEIVKAELAELPAELKFKKLREEKREKEGTEISKKKKKEKEAEEKPAEEAKATEEKKEEEKEKKATTVEAGKEIEKAAMKKAKHEAKVKSREPKRQFRQALQK